MRNERLAAEHVAHVRVLQLQAIFLHAAEKVAREIQIFGLTSRPGELYHRHFEFRMSGHEGALGGSEFFNNIVGETNTGIEQPAAPGGPVVSDTRLQEMSEAIVFMRAAQLGETKTRLIAHIVSVEISAGLLRRENMR